MINIYFSDTEAVEACICRLNVMWWCDFCHAQHEHGKNEKNNVTSRCAETYMTRPVNCKT